MYIRAIRGFKCCFWVEIKSGKMLTGEVFAGLNKWRDLAGDAVTEPTVMYGGTDNYSRNGIRVVGWDKVGNYVVSTPAT